MANKKSVVMLHTADLNKVLKLMDYEISNVGYFSTRQNLLKNISRKHKY